MKSERRLPVPYLDLDQATLAGMADHFRELSEAAREKTLNDAPSFTYKHPGETKAAHQKRLDEYVDGYKFWWAPTFGVTMEHGSQEDASWQDLWLRANYPDVRLITMSGRSAKTQVRVRLATTGSDSWSSDVRIDSEDPAEMDREIGYFTEFFKRHSAKFRERLRLESWLGGSLWFLLPSAAITALFMRYFVRRSPTTTEADWRGATVTVFVVAGACVGLLAYSYMSRLSPRVLVSGVGPLAWLRPYAVALAIGVVSSSIASLILLLVVSPK